jgi:glycosyltransferase involved in cell wall biosynthesis
METSMRRLLIITQTVDRKDPILGFFVNWIIAFSRHVDMLTVICLKKGDMGEMPTNVRVISLGKEEGVGHIEYLRRFFSAIIHYRQAYDSVFVHMNEIYVVLAGFLWRIMGKKIALWRNHPNGTWMTPVAVVLANDVYCTSPQSYTARFRKTVRMPAGIDFDAYTPHGQEARDERSLLMLGRISPIKKQLLFVEALRRLMALGMTDWTADIVGSADPKNMAYAETLRIQIQDPMFGGRIRLSPAVSSENTVIWFSTHAMFVNATPAGSLDKTVIEAIGCGAMPIVSNQGFADLIDEELRFKENDPDSLADRLRWALALPVALRDDMRNQMRQSAIRIHSLESLVDRVLNRLFSQ